MAGQQPAGQAVEQRTLAFLARQRFDETDATSRADRAYWHEILRPWPGALPFARRRRPLIPVGMGFDHGRVQEQAFSIRAAALPDEPHDREVILLTAFALALSAVTGAHQFLLGYRTAAFTLADAAAIIAPRTGEWPLPMRALGLEPAARARARIARLLQNTAAHARFDAASAELQFNDEMRASGQPPPQVAFTYAHTGDETDSVLTASDLTATIHQPPPRGMLHDLDLVVTDHATTVDAVMRFDAEVVDAATVDRIMSELANRLLELCGRPAEPNDMEGITADVDAPAVVGRGERPADFAVPTPKPSAVGAEPDAPPRQQPVTTRSNAVQVVGEYPVGRMEAYVLDTINRPGATIDFKQSWTLAQALRFNISLDAKRLERAFAAVVARHETLRARFAGRAGAWRIVVEDKHRTGINVIDAGPMSDAEALQLLRSRTRAGFDVENGPLAELDLMKCGSGGDIMLLRMHHLISDGWSQLVVYDEIVRSYIGVPLFGSKPIGYGAYMASYAKASDADEARVARYWETLLLPALAAPRLGRVAKGLPANLTGTDLGPVELLRLTFDKSGYQNMSDLAQKSGCTPLNLVWASFATTLAKAGGVDGLYFNTPVAMRGHAPLRNFCGYVAQYLPVRVDVNDAKAVPELAGLLNAQLTASIQNTPAPVTGRDLTVDDMINSRGAHLRQFHCGMLLPETTAKNAIFSQLLDHELGTKTRIGPVEVVRMDLDATRLPNVELDLRTHERAKSVQWTIGFDTLAFDREDVRRLVDEMIARLPIAKDSLVRAEVKPAIDYPRPAAPVAPARGNAENPA